MSTPDGGKLVPKPVYHKLGFDEEGIKYSTKIFNTDVFLPIKIHKLKKNNYINDLIKDKDVIQIKTTHDKGLHNARSGWKGKVILWGGGHWYQIHKD